MVAPVRERPPEVARAGRVDPRLRNAIGWSLAGHVFVVAAALLFALYAPAPTIFEAPPGGPVVDLVTPRGDSKVFKVGPLAKAGGIKGAPPKPEPPKPEPPKVEPPKAEPAAPPKPEPPKVEPKPEPPKPEPPKVEPKPTAIPEPKKPEPPKVEPKPEPKKPEPPKVEPKPEPKKPEPPKVEPKKPEPKPETKKPEPKKPEPKTPEPKTEPKKPEPKAEPKAEPAKPEPAKTAPAKPEPADTKPVVGDPDAGSSKAGATSSGGGSATEPGPSGDPNGGGGGAGNRSPEFYAYFGYMYRTIKEQWVWAGEQDATLAATVRFSILADGSIVEARITEHSRNSPYDESALKAVRATGKLVPPPPGVRADFEDIELVFQAGDLMQP